MNLVGPVTTPASTGGAGTSTASKVTTTEVRGYVVGVYVKYNDSPPAGTTDVTVRTKGTSPKAPSYNIVKVSNAAADGWFYPRVPIHSQAGAVVTDQYDWMPVDDLVEVLIEQANDGDSVDVWLLVD